MRSVLGGVGEQKKRAGVEGLGNTRSMTRDHMVSSFVVVVVVVFDVFVC